MFVSGLLDTFDDLLIHISPEEYQNYERQEPIPATSNVGGSYAQLADVSPEQGEKDESKPISDEDKNDKKKKKKKKKGDGDEEEDDEDYEPEMPDVPEKDCPPVDTDCKPNS
jgi:hypothetical protein